MAKMQMIVITGLSGAGKSTAIGILEDIGYYCVDNMPPKLIPVFAQLFSASGDGDSKIAVVADIRTATIFDELFESLGQLKKYDCSYRIIYLESSVESIIKRYKLTRRKHPLSSEQNGNMEKAVSVERAHLNAIRQKSDFIIDTSHMTATQLKERLTELLLGSHQTAIQVHCDSFGFKYGAPTEADLVFDVRCLPNPFYEQELKEFTGLDKNVRDYVLKWEQAKGLVPRLFDLVDYLLPLYVSEGKSQLVIAVGCTGGRHRSVVFAQLLGEHLAETWANVHIHHRDIEK